MKTKPQPLDLEEIKIIISDIGKKKAEQLVNYFKYKLKSACEFYLRYKDKPVLLFKNFPEYKELAIKDKAIIPDLEGKFTWLTLDYNEWLFKLAFKDIFK